MRPVCLHDKREIEKLLRKDDVSLHIYEIGDLDDRYWPYTIWYSLPGKEPRPVLLLYTRFSPPTLLGITLNHTKKMRELIRMTIPLLPERIYAHLSPGLLREFRKDFKILDKSEDDVNYHKMALKKPLQWSFDQASQVIHLGKRQRRQVERLYRHDVGIAFDPHMLETGYFFGLRRDGKLVSAGGVHVYSRTYGVAALGSVVTHPDFRGQGLATALCAHLCRELRKKVAHIGLNVRQNNTWAVRCYQNLGFEPVAAYQEWNLARR